jgi:putative transposase
MYGAPLIVQTDSAKEFIAPGFRYGCQKMGSEARTRLIAQPRYGGTVERLIGKLMRKFRLLPGSTYNDMLKKATRKPVRDALYTMTGLEWEAVRDIGWYHDQRHTALGMTPRQAWDRELANKGHLGPPLPITSPELFLIDFLPRIKRPVNRLGIEQGGGGRHYWTEELRPLIPHRQSVFVRPDPRDVRNLWIELPGEGGYVRGKLVQPRDFTGITELDWRAWLARRRGPPVLNHGVHSDLLDESRENRARAAAKVKAYRKTAKTLLQARRQAVQNRMFQQQARDREGSGATSRQPPDGPGAPTSPNGPAQGRPQLTVVRTTSEEPDLSGLKATPSFVFRRNPRQR